MPAKDPTPITPEGKRAAEKIRTLFFAIAAANLVLFAIVLWKQRSHKEPEAKPAPPVPGESNIDTSSSVDGQSPAARGK